MKKLFYEDFKDFYYEELERKENYNNKIGIILTIYSLISVPLLYCLNNSVRITSNDKFSIMFYCVFVISLILLLISIYYAIRSFWGHKYKYIPSPKELDNFINETSNYFDEYASYFKQKGIDKLQYLEERKKDVMYAYYIDATTNNLLENEIKVKKFTICTYFMGMSVVLILISCVLLQFVSISEEPTSVHIENSIIQTEEVKSTMCDEEKTQSNTPPEPPQAPELRTINETFAAEQKKENTKENK